MPIDTRTPGSPGWWMQRLLRQLGDRQDRLNRLDRYYNGDPDLPWGPTNVQEMFRQFQRKARANWAELIVDAPRERIQFVGFRTTDGDGDPTIVDGEANRIWEANNLDADQNLVHGDALSMSMSYVIVGGVDAELAAPLITPEDPRQVITAHDPARRRKVIAALKVFTDEWSGNHRAYVYLPGLVFRAVRRDSSDLSYEMSGWDWVSEPAQLPAPVVPVVPFIPRPRGGRALGEFEPVMDDIDRINVMILQRMTIAVLQAFKQLAVKGLPDTDQFGNEIDYSGVFSATPGAVWQLPAEADMWESGVVDLTPILESVKADIRDLAATTRTPMFYLFPDAANGSAEGASLMREGLVFKTQDRIRQMRASWEKVMQLAFLFSGDQQRARPQALKALWVPPERFSLAERYDAASKAQAAGVPWRSIMVDVLQFTPGEVDRMEAERAADVFGAVVNPTPEQFGAPV